MKLYKKRTNRGEGNRGVALLIAILVGSVALAVGLGVYHRAYKELVFASFWKQAQIAFSAADSGLECAMYWDKQVPAPASASCFGATFAWPPTYPVVWTLPNNNGCSTVTVTKTGSAPVVTTIESRGHNTCSAGSIRSVERAIGVTY